MKIAVIGGGAAGLFFVGHLLDQAPDLSVTLFEQGPDLGRKLLATGNGRCNFTNAHLSVDHYTGPSHQQLAPLLDRFDFEAVRTYFFRLGLPSVTLESGMTYPMSLSAQSLFRLLQGRLQGDHLVLHLLHEVSALDGEEGSFFLQGRVKQDQGEGFFRSGPFDLVVLASGGAYGIGKKEWSCGYSLAKAQNHQITSLHAGICGVVVSEPDFCRRAAGDKVRARVKGAGKVLEDDVLFTDYGLSGMGIFRLSNDLLEEVPSPKKQVVTLELWPQWAYEDMDCYLTSLLKKRSSWQVEDALAGLLPPRLLATSLWAVRWGGRVEESDETQRQRWLYGLKHLSFQVEGSRKKDHGQVTCGGIALNEVDLSTMSSRKTPGLYFIGEVLDAQGECGGYNLHWAWASAWQAAEAILHRASCQAGKKVLL